jgi:HK97 family phage prohead protease/HK97 family phage major capsid protein
MGTARNEWRCLHDVSELVTAMPISPGKDETQSEFMARCVPEMIGTGPDKRPQAQAVAACLQIWRDRNKQIKQPAPDPDESYDDFMSRCVEETDDEEACQMAWEDRAAPAVIQKTHSGQVDGAEYVLSDESPDRIGDVIKADGWQLANFRRNPVALAFHRSDFVIGTWKNLRIENGALRGHLELAPEGTSDRIDEIRRLVDAGILKATSVGFRPLKHEPIDSEKPWKGTRFIEQELVETSLVSVPANPNALAVAKGLDISRDTLALVFAEQGKENDRIVARGSTGKHAASQSSNRKGAAMSGLGQKIIDAQTRIRENCDRLQTHYENLNNENVSDQEMETTNRLNADIARDRQILAMLEESEKQLGGTVSNGGGNGKAGLPAIRPPADNGNGIDENERERRKQYFQTTSGKKDLQPLDYAVRAGVVTYIAKVMGRSPDEICRSYEPYNNDRTRAIVDWNMRAAVNPAMTTVTGWAAELVTQINADYLGLLQPQSVFPRLAAKGLALSFGRAGRINIPMRSATPTIAGSFVGEGLPIPVRRGAFTSQVLTPKKLAVITTWTRELDSHSVPAIEGLLRDAIGEDTAIALDSVLLDSNAATVIRPAGLLNGVAALTATALGGNAFNAIIGDLKQLMGALVTSTNGNIRSPVLLMNPADVLSASMIVPPNTGVMPFREELARGTLINVPVIDSGTVAAKTLILVDAADFVTVGAEGPTFDVSDTATIHEEDTTPAAIVGGTAPGTPATPVRSLWQTDTLALRMIQRLNFTMRRTGMVSWVQNITW